MYVCIYIYGSQRTECRKLCIDSLLDLGPMTSTMCIILFWGSCWAYIRPTITQSNSLCSFRFDRPTGELWALGSSARQALLWRRFRMKQHEAIWMSSFKQLFGCFKSQVRECRCESVRQPTRVFARKLWPNWRGLTDWIIPSFETNRLNMLPFHLYSFANMPGQLQLLQELNLSNNRWQPQLSQQATNLWFDGWAACLWLWNCKPFSIHGHCKTSKHMPLERLEQLPRSIGELQLLEE